MLKVCRWRFLSFFGTAHVTQKLLSFLFWKFYWVWHDVGGMPRIIKKMMDFWKNVSGCRQCQKFAVGGSWVSLALLTWLRSYRLWYFRSFHKFVVMPENRPELSAKWRTFGDLFFRQWFDRWQLFAILE